MKILEVYTKKLRFLGYAENSIESYTCYLKEFLELEKVKDPYQVTTYKVENYLVNYSYSSRSKQNQIISSLKLFAREILGKSDIHLDKIKRPRRYKKLPRIIDAEFMAEKIKSIQNTKHRTILTIGLSCGLRISEVQNLKWEHLDRDRNILNVKQGKGNKDRCCLLNNDTIKLLDAYYREFKHIDKFLINKEYVFTGQNNPKYSQTSIQNIVKKYIHSKESFHCLRHSYCTYAIDNGTGTKALSISMGHNSVRTIEQTYFHQSTRTLKTIKQAI